MAQFQDFVRQAGLQELDLLALADPSVHDPHIRDRPAKLVVMRIKHHRLQRRVRIALRRRHAQDNRLQQLGDPEPGLAADPQHLVGVDAQRMFDLFQHFLRPGVLQVDLVQGRDDRQVVFQGRVGVGHGLGLDTLKRVHQQQGAFAADQRTGDLVGEIDMARRVDQIQLVRLAVPVVAQANGTGLDGNASGPLQVHVVQQLVAHLAHADRAGVLQQPVRQRALAVVDVGDNAEVADMLAVDVAHAFCCAVFTMSNSRPGEPMAL